MHFDTLIQGGRVVDGSGRAAAPLAVGIIGDRIAAVGLLDGAMAARVIDAAGKVVAPGFIDVHVHSELALLGGPHRYGAVAQGVTTHLLAPDGFDWAPLPPDPAGALWEYRRFAHGEAPVTPDWPTPDASLDRFPGHSPANVVPQVPHCAVRLAAMGWNARPATDDELEQMQVLTRAWLDAGAVCLNFGLDYQPSAFADLRELIALCAVAREYDAIYAAHLRYTKCGRAGAWREIIALCHRADIPVHVSHESVDEITGPLLDEAADICDLTFESYLYPAGCTHLAMMLPLRDQAGGTAGIRARLANPVDRAQMRADLHRTLTAACAVGERAVSVANQTGQHIGMTIDDAAASTGEPRGDFALRTLEEEDRYALMVYHRGGSAADQASIARESVRHPRVMIASDGVYHGPSVHPRGYGCFARVLRHYVREMAAVTLEETVWKMSGFPAERFRIKNRGLLCPGYGADVVVFDLETVADRATWDDPFRTPMGIDHVIVNGVTVIENAQPTGALPGCMLRPLV